MNENVIKDLRTKIRLHKFKIERPSSVKMYNTIDQRVSVFDDQINRVLLTQQNHHEKFRLYHKHTPFKIMFNDINYESIDEYLNQKGKSIETIVKKVQKRFSTPYELLVNNIKEFNKNNFSNKTIKRTLLPFEKNQNIKNKYKKIIKLKQNKNNFLNNYTDLIISPENNNNKKLKKPIKLLKFPIFKNKELSKLNNLKITIENPNYISYKVSNNNIKNDYQAIKNKINITKNYFYKPQYYYNYLTVLKTDEKIKLIESINSV
jgi:hypothetical protein